MWMKTKEVRFIMVSVLIWNVIYSLQLHTVKTSRFIGRAINVGPLHDIIIPHMIYYIKFHYHDPMPVSFAHYKAHCLWSM